jgi:hypothetical protein
MARKKIQSHTIDGVIKAAQAAASPLPKLPDHVKLNKCDLPFFEAILRARARDEWDEVSVVLAAQLARCQRSIEEENERLEAEGSVIENARGTQVMNPRHSVLEQLSRREMAVMRSLRLTGAANGEVRDLEKNRKLQRQAEGLKDELQDEDDLLAL